LRDGFLPGEPEHGPFRKKRAAVLAVSLALHALLLVGLYHARMTFRILPFGKQVRSVFLAPPVRMTVPGRIEDYIRNSPSLEPYDFGTRRDAKRAAPAPAAPPGNPAEGRADDKETGLAPDNFMKGAPGTPPNTGREFGGDLSLSSLYGAEGDGKLRINLLAIPDHVQDAPLGFEGGVPAGRSFRRYVLPGLPGTAADPSRARGSAGPGGGGQRASAVVQSPGYDISPWASLVMDRIQLNWRIPEAPDVLGKSEIRIAVTIDKNGTFSAFAIQQYADLEVLNAAASAALRSSAPLPPLPDDFPAADLEATFVFSYKQ
jgi:hypothetical protein